MKSGNLLKEFTGHTGFVNDVAFTLDGPHVLSGSSDGSVRIWSVRTTECNCNYKVCWFYSLIYVLVLHVDFDHR